MPSFLGVFFDRISYYWDQVVHYFLYYFKILPLWLRYLLIIVFVFAIIGILMSHGKAIYENRHEWKKKPRSNLMFSYACGSGQAQHKLIYQEAHELLRDKKWSWLCIAGVAWRLGNFVHPSKILLFFLSLIYLPLKLIGIIEMILRITIGTVWLIIAALVHALVLLVMRLISYLAIPFWKLVDKTMRIEQHCPHCYASFDLPAIKCPHCNTTHEALLPSRCGILVARCVCDHFLPSTVITGRSRLEATCPVCDGELVVTNARQFSVQVVGGDTSGITAFLAAFQHEYIKKNAKRTNLTITGAPQERYDALEDMYQRGNTVPSSASTVQTYNLIHKTWSYPKDNLVFYDVPDEIILSENYHRSPIFYKYLDGIIFVIDPLSVVSVREESLQTGDNRTLLGYSKDDADTLIVNFTNQFSAITGRPSQQMSKIPVAVIINKIDIKAIRRKIGFPKIKSIYNANPAAYGYDYGKARDEICRAYLYDIGLSNTANIIESVFVNVSYFPVSAIGHVIEAGKPFTPLGVIEPVAWLTKQSRSRLHRITSNKEL